MSDPGDQASNARTAGAVEDEPIITPAPRTTESRSVGRRRREGFFEGNWDAHFASSVRAAAAAAFAEAAYQPPQHAYVTLARELTNRGVHPDPPAVFDAAMLISRGLPPPVLRQQQLGRHRRHDPA